MTERASDARAILSDDGMAIRLVIYEGARTAGEVELTPERAIALAGELIAAGLRRLR